MPAWSPTRRYQSLAASLPRTAAERDAMAAAPLEPTPLSDRAEYDFRADVTEALPRPAEAVPA